MIKFQNMDKKINQITEVLGKYNLKSVEEAEEVCIKNHINVASIVRGIQPICFEDACVAYTVGTAMAISAEVQSARDAALILGEALQAFCTKGSVSDERQVGVGHGKLAAMVLSEEVKCFAFLAGHESFAAADGAIGIVQSANRVRKRPLRVILNGLGKDAAKLISRMNGFTYVKTEYDYKKNHLSVINRKSYSEGDTAQILCYGADDVREGIAVMELEDVDVSISGNGTNMVRFTHLVAGTYKKKSLERGKKYFACASGGGIGRSLGPDETSAGPASYGITDSMSRMYGDTTFAGSSSVPAHVAMMGFIGMGNNPMVGATVKIAVMIEENIRNKIMGV